MVNDKLRKIIHRSGLDNNDASDLRKELEKSFLIIPKERVIRLDVEDAIIEGNNLLCHCEILKREKCAMLKHRCRKGRLYFVEGR